jgi:hypothetical protein
MCECTIIADGAFTPITINENKMQFIYKDAFGFEHVLIREFAMNITISKANVCEIKDDNGKIIAYQFKVE